MKRTVLFFLLFCCCLSMQIAKSDPHRNQTIVKVLAAYCNIGVYQTNSGTYDYIQSVTFAKIASQFLDFFAKQPVKTGLQSEKMMVTGHTHKFLQIKEEA
ncbi:MAG: hypothetical protein KBD43_16880 [Saprospiraceae bacterium]|nr:hypothetical protein [Saprospiraceae bacterium]MBP9847732.1 hypothetical protein [Saprospiraceae bacterium]